MESFYLTFPYRLPDLAKRYQVVRAENMAEARAMVLAYYGNTGWAFIYTAEEFKGQPEQFGLTPLDMELWV